MNVLHDVYYNMKTQKLHIMFVILNKKLHMHICYIKTQKNLHAHLSYENAENT